MMFQSVIFGDFSCLGKWLGEKKNLWTFPKKYVVYAIEGNSFILKGTG